MTLRLDDDWGDGGTQYIARWNDKKIANSVLTGKVDTVKIGKCEEENKESLVFSRNDDTSSAIDWIPVGNDFEFQNQDDDAVAQIRFSPDGNFIAFQSMRLNQNLWMKWY